MCACCWVFEQLQPGRLLLLMVNGVMRRLLLLSASRHMLLHDVASK